MTGAAPVIDGHLAAPSFGLRPSFIEETTNDNE